jgi:EAL domain-containing protein (putative c-di-GMP-specific phosphodiesterase class I)
MRRQTLMYAKELRLLYGKERAEGEEKRARTQRILRIISDSALEMVFQPIVDLRKQRIVGLEALARFNAEPKRSPDIWFAEAAQVGLQEELELLALRLACDHLDQIPDRAYLSLNVSPETAASPRLLTLFDGIPVGRLVFEVTEHAHVSDYAPLTRALNALRARGGRLAVDDAGAGFASLRHILRLSPDFIKLDISLTRDIVSDRAGRALASALIGFAFDIGKKIVAEGIESRDQVDALRDMGVRYGQGYFLARPGTLPLERGILPSLN